MSKSIVAGKTQPMKAGTEDFRKLVGKPPQKQPPKEGPKIPAV